MLVEAVGAGSASAGADVVEVGAEATPTIARAVHHPRPMRGRGEALAQPSDR